MTAQKKTEIKEWVEKIAAANQEQSSRCFGIDSVQDLYPPCPEAELRLYEQSLGRPLPPSYRKFLRLHNGWGGFSRNISLLGTRYRQEKDLLAAIEEFQAIEALDGKMGAATGIFVAAAPDGRYFLYYDIHTRRKNGEMELVEYIYPKGEVCCYPDLTTYLMKHFETYCGGGGETLVPSLNEEMRMVLVDAAQGQELLAQRDLNALKALWAEKEWVRSSLLQSMAINVPPWAASDRNLLLAFQQELLGEAGPVDLRGLAIAAFLEYDLELFDKVALTMGDNVAGLEFFAQDLLEQKKYAEALKVLIAVVNSPKASLDAWSQLVDALLEVEIPEFDASALLLRAEARGRSRGEIFHKVARVWLKLGKEDRALAAIANAVRSGQLKLEDLHKDGLLADLHQDPKFNRLFLEAYQRETPSSKLNRRV